MLFYLFLFIFIFLFFGTLFMRHELSDLDSLWAKKEIYWGGGGLHPVWTHFEVLTPRPLIHLLCAQPWFKYIDCGGRGRGGKLKKNIPFFAAGTPIISVTQLWFLKKMREWLWNYPIEPTNRVYRASSLFRKWPSNSITCRHFVYFRKHHLGTGKRMQPPAASCEDFEEKQSCTRNHRGRRGTAIASTPSTSIFRIRSFPKLFRHRTLRAGLG